MKCPYQTRLIHKPERTKGYEKYFAEDITEFCECLKEQCPFYYVTRLYSETPIEQKEVCRRAESEVSKLYVKTQNDRIQNTF